MSETASSRPRVNQDQIQKRLLLQMQLMRDNAQLRNFTPLRDQLAASGKDAEAKYRQIQSHRDQVASELKRLIRPTHSKQSRSAAMPWRPGWSPSLPVAAGRFLPGSLSPWLGYSGIVQLDSAQEGMQVYPPGTTGVIETLELDGYGGVYFDGDIVAMPVEGYPHNPGTFVDADEYFWLQNWSYVLPFPAPVVDSMLTYSFKILAQAAVLAVRETALAWSYLSVGETPDFTGQQELVVDTSVGFPFAMADLNARDGFVRGELDVQRSFRVQGGHIPAVAMIVGIAVSISWHGEVIFDDSQDCVILPGSDVGGEGVVHFRYDPLPPPAHL